MGGPTCDASASMRMMRGAFTWAGYGKLRAQLGSRVVYRVLTAASNRFIFVPNSVSVPGCPAPKRRSGMEGAAACVRVHRSGSICSGAARCAVPGRDGPGRADPGGCRQRIGRRRRLRGSRPPPVRGNPIDSRPGGRRRRGDSEWFGTLRVVPGLRCRAGGVGRAAPARHRTRQREVITHDVTWARLGSARTQGAGGPSRGPRRGYPAPRAVPHRRWRRDVAPVGRRCGPTPRVEGARW